mmetsp:Transcript_3353/g.7076  ORF Transcript_3353/g.7076 Transcript_3353/m.7076 type:complete len:439 (-) Transcript_3353:56-1372(-)
MQKQMTKPTLVLFLLLCAVGAATTDWWPPEELSDDTSCVENGIEAVDYRYALAMSPCGLCEESDVEVFHPLFASKYLDSEDPEENITLATVFIHGLAGDANTYFCDAMASAPSNVLVVAPWFGDDQASGADWEEKGDSSTLSTYWNTQGWVSGGDASPSPSRFTTSFDVLDTIIRKLASAKATGRFPNLERVTVTGFSAGAQLASRWSVFSALGNGGEELEIGVRTVVADGSSYLYFDETRPSSTCLDLFDTGVEHVCDEFSLPEDADTCMGYNSWKFGVNFTDLGSSYMYLDPFAADSTLVDEAITLYLNNSDNIKFIFGNEDVCNCNTEGYTNTNSEVCYPSGTICSPNDFGGELDGIQCCDTYPDTGSSNALATGCESMMQGTNRLQRGLNYMSYTKAMQAKLNLESSFEFGFFDGGHSDQDFFASELFQKWVYS